jgi:hypothetical protein
LQGESDVGQSEVILSHTMGKREILALNCQNGNSLILKAINFSCFISIEEAEKKI